MPIILYTIRLPSPPGRAVEIIIKILKLDVEKREIDLPNRENLEPWFLELNPTHQVPVLDDNGYILTDSHAIIAYLLTVYAPKDILEQYYPTDPKLRGIIDSRWHFQNGILFARVENIIPPLVLGGAKDIPLEYTSWMIEGVDFLEKFLEGKVWLAGDRLTVADISTVTTIDLVELIVPLRHYKNVSAWMERVRMSTPFYKEMGVKVLNEFSDYFKKNFSYDSEDRWNQIKNSLKE